MDVGQNYAEVKLSDVYFPEEERQRTLYQGISELAESIREKGLLQPIGIEGGTNKLCWGGRRFLACQKLGLDTVVAKIIPPGMSPLELEEIELLENVERENLTWAEELEAVRRIDEIKKQRLGNAEETRSRDSWSSRKTAKLLNRSASGVAADLELAEAMDIMPELREAPNKSEAHKRWKKAIEGIAVKQLAKDLKDSPSSSAFRYASGHYKIGNAIEGLKSLDKTQASFAEVDPPYAIDLQKNKKSDKLRESLDQYNEVTVPQYLMLVRDVGTELFRVLSDNAWMIFWFGIEHYKQTYDLLTKAQWKVDKIPGIWYKEGGQGQTKRPEEYLGRAYETFFICRKGQPALRKAGRQNVFSIKPVPHQKKIHPTEKPLLLYSDLLETFTYPGSYIISPFLGSGTILRAAYMKGLSGFGWNLEEYCKEGFLARVYEDEQSGLYGGKSDETNI